MKGDLLYKDNKYPTAVIVQRGNCTYEEKAIIATNSGVSALIIIDTVKWIYENMTYLLQNDNLSKSIKTMIKMTAYDCHNGQAEITSYNSSLEPWDPFFNISSCSEKNSCASHRCMLTENNGTNVCCIWDLPSSMAFADDNISNPEIEVIHLGSTAGDALMESVSDGFVEIYPRYNIPVDPSQIFIWIIAIIILVVGSYRAASYERKMVFDIKSKTRPGISLDTHTNLRERIVHDTENEMVQWETSMEITKWHALGFILFGSGFLILLYYFNIVIIVVVLFTIASISSTTAVLFAPTFRYIISRICGLKSATRRFFGFITIGDIVGFLCGIVFSLSWFFTRDNAYAWILQDISGCCLCWIFLSTIRLPNLKIAILLLILVFIYDIFFVFITPYIFQESVMLRAATGGQHSNVIGSDEFCRRYPMNRTYKCYQEPIPILIRLPTIISWSKTQVMLGLGDIVLPGLLVVFCARYDYLTRTNIVGKIGSLDATELTLGKKLIPGYGENLLPGYIGYYNLMCIGYAVGLFFANIAVVLMKTGQPALLYLVPCTLGVCVLISWRFAHFANMWNGPIQFMNITHDASDAGKERRSNHELTSNINSNESLMNPSHHNAI